MKTKLFLRVLLCCTAIVSAAHAEEIGSVDTKFKLLGPDHKIVIEAFDDPKIEGITCHLSRSKLWQAHGARLDSSYGKESPDAREHHDLCTPSRELSGGSACLALLICILI